MEFARERGVREERRVESVRAVGERGIGRRERDEAADAARETVEGGEGAVEARVDGSVIAMTPESTKVRRLDDAEVVVRRLAEDSSPRAPGESARVARDSRGARRGRDGVDGGA